MPSLEEVFNQFNKDRPELLDQFYDDSIHFQDPVTDLQGLPALKKYYLHLYENVISIKFEFDRVMNQDHETLAVWTMVMRHKNLKGGEEIRLPGVSYVKFSPTTKKAIYHRDYFDAAAMVYEQIPVLGSVIRMIKSRLHPE